jgi:acid stress-induced BolA-like protein IbaG/YrbA
VSSHATDFQGDVLAAIRTAVEGAIAGARCDVTGSDGHYTIVVTSPAFAGLSMVASQRLVYSAIAHLMKGAAPPIHAVDTLQTRTA